MADKKAGPRLQLMELAGVVSGLAGIVLLRLLAVPRSSMPSQAKPATATDDSQGKEKEQNAGQVAPAPTLRPGWHTLPPEPLPRPTYWPAVMALGIVFCLWGIVTTFLVSGIGLILFVIALSGWIGDMLHED